MKLCIDNGGRVEAGFRGKTGDCVVRAIAIATSRPYAEVYDAINALADEHERPRRGKRSSSRTGVFRRTYERYLLEVCGARWTPTMAIGQGCKVHLCDGELPATGRLVVSLSRHLCAIIDGVIHDTHDPSRDGTRCVYGYYTLPPTCTRCKAAMSQGWRVEDRFCKQCDIDHAKVLASLPSK